MHHKTPYTDLNELAHSGFRQAMHAPLLVSGQSIGTLNMAHGQANAYGTAELERLQQIASLTAASVERQKLLQATQASMERHRHHAKRLEILNGIGHQLSSATTKQEVFHIVAHAIEQVLETDRVSYVVLESDDQHYNIMALTGNDAIPKATRLPLKGSSMGFVLERNQPTFFPDFTDIPYPEHKILQDQGLRMAWCAPIQVSGKTVGILNAATKQKWRHPEDGLTLVTILGRFMGTTFERIQAQKDVDTTLKEFEYQASHDALTGLPNRDRLQQALDQALTQAKANQKKLAILFVDLDRFKEVNDGLSHNIGDILLCNVAKRMRGRLRPCDLVARTGGDEFVVLLPDIMGQEMASMLAQRLLTTLRDPFQIEGHQIQIGGSIGMSLFPHHGATSADLMKHADIAMYAAKESGRDNYQVYAPKMSAKLRLRLALERDLKLATSRDEFALLFQPQFDLVNHKITSIEALIRWNHPSRGWSSPSQFLSIAEDSGLIRQITTWVLEESLRTIHFLRQQHPGLYVSVNISAPEFLEPALITEQIEAALSRHHLPGSALEIELKERVFLEHSSAANEAIQSWKKQGVHLAIDDFGIGFSSLNHLLNLPIDSLKIARSFIQVLPNDLRTQGIVKAILAMGHNLGATCIAEGVETTEQYNLLRQLGCPKAQGFGLAQPMTLEDLCQCLKSNRTPQPQPDLGRESLGNHPYPPTMPQK